MKKYQIKTYNLDWSYNATIDEKVIINEVAFTSNIDWGCWQLSIQTSYKIDDPHDRYGKYVKVVLFDEYHKGGKQIYFWFISQIIRQVDASSEYTTFVCLGVWSLLNSILFANWSYTKTPSDMVKDVLTAFQSHYWCITQWTIDTSDSTTQNYSWNYQSCFEIIKSVSEWSWSKFFIDWEWKLNFFKTWRNHFLHLHYDVEKMTITDTIESVVNNYTLARNWAVGTYTDSTSIATYWRKDKYEMNSSLNSTATMDQYWNQYIEDNKNPKEEMSITLNTKTPFEDIQPWDTVSVLNAWIVLDNKVVNKISYKPDQCILTIDRSDTLWNVIE